jgi:hypothetical protein
MKTKLQKALAAIAPSICIQTIWEHDPDARFPDSMMDENPDKWNPWQSEVRASAIVAGEEITGSEHFGETWELSGDDPATSNPDISGYENQMTREALEELACLVPDNHPLASEIIAALDYCKAESRREWEAAEIEASRNRPTTNAPANLTL